MKLLLLAAAALLAALQYRLWFGAVGLRAEQQLLAERAAQEQKLALLKARNGTLRAEVIRLKANDAALEERARFDLGLVKTDEVFYFVPEPLAAVDRGLAER